MVAKGEAAAKTKYHVLRQTRLARTASSDQASASGGSVFAGFDLVAEDVEANSDDQAKRLYAQRVAASDPSIAGATLVAVPARSWRPEKAAVEVEYRVSLS